VRGARTAKCETVNSGGDGARERMPHDTSGRRRDDPEKRNSKSRSIVGSIYKTRCEAQQPCIVV
jgi:hypothetical protein